MGDQRSLAVHEGPRRVRTSTSGPTSSPNALVGDLGKVFGITPGAHLSWLVFLAIVAAVVVWFLIRRTRLGYEARAVGRPRVPPGPAGSRSGRRSCGCS